MPIQSRLPPGSGGFDPETIRTLTAAFEDTWRTLEGDGSIGPDADAKRDQLARLIIALAQAGERDIAKIRDDAIAFMRLASV